MMFRSMAAAVVAAALFLMAAAGGLAAQVEAPWRMRVREAAVAAGATVTLGDIATPVGEVNAEAWRTLAATALWPAPEEPGRPLIVNKVKLQQVLRDKLGDMADLCLLPPSLALQRGGGVLVEDDLRAIVVRTLTPLLGALPGQAELKEFRLPPYAFLAHPQQRVVLEPVQPGPGRLSLRFAVLELDGAVVRRFTGSVFVDLWVDVPCAARPLNKGDFLTPEAVTFMRKNLAHLRDIPWDGRGGPWQAQRAVGTGQVIYQTDLGTQPIIRKGAVVTLVYETATMRLSVQAEAMGDGAPGETIAVRNLQSRKQVYGTVRDGSTVMAR